MRCQWDWFSILIQGFQGLLVSLNHIISITMIRSDDKTPFYFVHNIQQLLEALIDQSTAVYCSLQITCVANHVWICKVQSDLIKFAGSQSFFSCCCNLSRLHVRLFVEGNSVRWDFQICLKILIKIPTPVSIPEESDMTKLLCLGADKSSQTIFHQKFPRNSRNCRWWHQKLCWELEVSIILHHSSKLNLWHTNTIKGGEILIFQCFA
mmetsp:Transcript_13659/g.27279  ORF Transcript_13659/g.27279 Transcript_13659/m.27279 type:complete len:208 (+) Transcript_13659:1323-1946(+)